MNLPLPIFHSTLSVTATLCRLTEAAQLLIAAQHKEVAAELLAYILHHPETPPATYQQADTLFDDLEAELCPRVIWDARAQAKTATLPQIVAKLRSEALAD
ncbi:MAG: hypothetical protein ACOYL5_18390 [Phototrophicaceae bacterium]|jgi:hypothetical protein